MILLRLKQYEDGHDGAMHSPTPGAASTAAAAVGQLLGVSTRVSAANPFTTFCSLSLFAVGEEATEELLDDESMDTSDVAADKLTSSAPIQLAAATPSSDGLLAVVLCDSPVF
jgi:hypothetical protein